ncbi:hypothetical protein Q1695_002790 [Nippostrongylus brasiliensis]|nr:hypothetical protein Q1695_002790 [Nippostrongylus brasiliensis]
MILYLDSCIEENDLMACFNSRPTSRVVHPRFIPNLNSGLRSIHLRHFEEILYRRLLALLQVYRMNRSAGIHTSDIMQNMMREERPFFGRLIN